MYWERKKFKEKFIFSLSEGNFSLNFPLCEFLVMDVRISLIYKIFFKNFKVIKHCIRALDLVSLMA